MNAIGATWKNGQIIPDSGIDWPDGCRLIVKPESVAMPIDDDGPATPEEIAQTLAAMARVEPFEMTDEERAEIEDWRRRVKEHTIATMNKDIEELYP
jgi:hypothetical protein